MKKPKFKAGQIIEADQAWKDTAIIIDVTEYSIKVEWITVNARDGEGFTTWIDIDNFDLGHRLLE